MKRLVQLLLATVFVFSTVGFALPNSPPESISAIGSVLAPNLDCHNVGLLRVCAWVSDAKLTPGSYITVYGMLKRKGAGVAGKIMRVIWASKTTETCIGVTDATGVASCTTYVPRNTPGGKRIHVIVRIDKYKITTFFNTRGVSQDPQQSD
jgi:hypothetical protein